MDNDKNMRDAINKAFDDFMNKAIDENQDFVIKIVQERVKQTKNIVILSCFFEMLRQTAESNIQSLDEQMSETERQMSRDLRTVIITKSEKVQRSVGDIKDGNSG